MCSHFDGATGLASFSILTRHSLLPGCRVDLRYELLSRPATVWFLDHLLPGLLLEVLSELTIDFWGFKVQVVFQRICHLILKGAL